MSAFSHFLSFFSLGLTAAFLVACGSASSKKLPPESLLASEPINGSSLESQTLYHVNNFRATRGKVDFKFHPGLTELARAHSQLMLRRGEMSHFDFKKRAAEITTKYPFQAVSENLHHYQSDHPRAEFIVQQWKDSPKHRKNMEGAYNYAGLGIARQGNQTYTTLLLARGTSPQKTPSMAPYLEF